MSKAFIFLSVITALIINGCLAPQTITPLQKQKIDDTIPVCKTKSDCDAKWSAARQWIQNNSGYKIQIYSDDLIETYNPINTDLRIAVSVSKNPIGLENGEQVNAIIAKISCGNMFGCNPPLGDAIISFNKYVGQASDNDPKCYANMIASDDKPKFGMFNRFSNGNFLVTSICKDSPAAVAGLKVYDIIKKINNISINSQLDTYAAFSVLDYGSSVNIEVLRDDYPLKMIVNLPQKDELKNIVAKKDGNKISSIEEKLETLVRLRDKGVISDDEYNVKKKDILDNL